MQSTVFIFLEHLGSNSTYYTLTQRLIAYDDTRS